MDWFRSPQLMIAKATVPVLSYPMPRRWISDAARRNRGGHQRLFISSRWCPFKALLERETFTINTLTQHIMNYFYKALILAVDIMMAVTLGLEIRDRISARKKNKDTEVADPEPVTTD